MALTDNKITVYADNVSDLSDTPNADGLTADQLKAFFDSRGDNEIKESINGICDDLTATADGASGADQIGATALTGGTATTTQGIMEELDGKIKAIPTDIAEYTNKTLTAPKINEDVVLTATATELNKLHGAELTTAEINLLTGKTGTVWTSDNDGPTSGLHAQYAAEALKLTNAKRVNGVSFNGTSDIKMIGTCDTAANVGTKIVAFTSDYSPAADTLFGVRFLYGNTAVGLSMTVAGQTKNVGLGDYQVGPLYLRPIQVYLFAVNQYNNRYDLVGYESQGNVVSLQDTGNYFTANNAEGALQEVGAHLVTTDGNVAARYTKTEMQTSGSALMHWDNLTNKPNLADNHWKTPVANQAALPLTGNGLEDCRVVLDDGDGKQAVYLCIATTGTFAEQWAKVADVDWMSEEQTRITQENARQASESDRVIAETNRGRDEDAREAAELVRKTSETSRISGESSRQTGEQTRFNNEETRKSNETARQNAEVVRAFLHPYDNDSSYAGGMKVTYEGSTYQALKASLGNLPTNTEFWICIAQKGDNTTAANVSIADAEGHFTAENVEEALAETASALEETSNLVSTNAEDIGIINKKLTNGFSYNVEAGLRTWRSRLNSPLKNVLVIGDSIGEGYYASNIDTQGYVGLIRSKLQSLYGNGGIGYLPLNRDGWTLSGTWTSLPAYGFLGCCKYATGAINTASVVMTGDNFDIHVVAGGGSGTFTVQIDSEAPVTHNPGESNETVKFNVIATSNAEHTVVISAPATGNIYLVGISANIGSSGCRVNNASLSGGAMTSLTYSYKEDFINPISPDLTILAMGVNDFSSQQTLADFRTATVDVLAKALLYGSVLIVGECESNLVRTIPQKDYEAVLIDVANEYGCAFVSIYDRWKDFTEANRLNLMHDASHPNTNGHYDWAQGLLKHIVDV